MKLKRKPHAEKPHAEKSHALPRYAAPLGRNVSSPHPIMWKIFHMMATAPISRACASKPKGGKPNASRRHQSRPANNLTGPATLTPQ
jgi:hypothetical protein